MGKRHDIITAELREWIGQQKVFFVATAPLSGEGHVNCSPKGGDTFRILGDREVAYLDLTGKAQLDWWHTAGRRTPSASMDYQDTGERNDEALAFTAADPSVPEVVELLAGLSSALREITGNSGEGSFQSEDVQHPRAVLLVARLGDRAVGCGALRRIDDQTCELKRMFVAQPRCGIGGRLLAELEHRARWLGYSRIILETRTVNTAAVNFYLKHGYRVIPNYGKYAGRSEAVCFEKRAG